MSEENGAETDCQSENDAARPPAPNTVTGGLSAHQLLDALAVVRGFPDWQSYTGSLKHPAVTVVQSSRCSHRGCARAPWCAGRSGLCIMHHFGLSERLAAAAEMPAKQYKTPAPQCKVPTPQKTAPRLFVGPLVPPGFCWPKKHHCGSCGEPLPAYMRYSRAKVCPACRQRDYQRLLDEKARRSAERTLAARRRKRSLRLAERYIVYVTDWLARSCEKMVAATAIVEEHRQRKTWRKIAAEREITVCALAARVKRYACHSDVGDNSETDGT